MTTINTRYEIYEDNSGGLAMVILDNDAFPIRIFDGFEYGPEGILSGALEELSMNPSAYNGWDGDTLMRINDDREYYDIPALTIGELYDEIQEGKLIADNYGLYSDRMGAAGKIAFSIVENW